MLIAPTYASHTYHVMVDSTIALSVDGTKDASRTFRVIVVVRFVSRSC